MMKTGERPDDSSPTSENQNRSHEKKIDDTSQGLQASRQVLTSRVGKHAHQRSQLRRAPPMRNVQPSPSWAMDAASWWLLGRLLRLLLPRLPRLLGILLLLLLLHGGQVKTAVEGERTSGAGSRQGSVVSRSRQRCKRNWDPRLCSRCAEFFCTSRWC